MPYYIEILSVGGDFDSAISEAAQSLNGPQEEFRFSLPPERLRQAGASLAQSTYVTTELFEFLRAYRSDAKGERPYLVAVVDKELSSKRLGNIFGGHEAGDGFAAITLYDHRHFVESTRLFLNYYFIRYALSFVCPTLRNHDETRGCFFDRKMQKADIVQSLDSGSFCDECRQEMWRHLNEEEVPAIAKMTSVMKSLRSSSQDVLLASSLKGQIDIGIITMREDDEYEAVLSRFPSWRHVRGSGSDYSYSRVQPHRGRELRVTVARTPEQGQSAAQATASSMISDLGPPWILLVGIAGGIPASEYTLGDVLLSQRIHDFSVSAAIEGKPPQFQDMGGPMALEVEKLVTSLRSRKEMLGNWGSKEFIGRNKPVERVPASWDDERIYGDDSWKKSVWESLRRHFVDGKSARDPLFRAAVLLTSGTLVKSTTLASQ